MRTCDKNLRPLMIGDIIKVYHYTAAKRRKRHYMYKQIIGYKTLGGGNGGKIPLVDYFEISHLNLDITENYYVGRYEGIKVDYEIIQCLYCAIGDRAKETTQ